MQQPSVIHSTFVLERSYRQKPELIFSAFANATLKRRWFVEGESHDVEHYELDFRLGGAERVRRRLKEGTPFPGVAVVTEGTYLDITPNQCIVTASRMTLGDRPISAALVTFEFLRTDKGTDLLFTHQGAYFEGSGGPEILQDGWRKLFQNLEKELTR